MMPALAAGLILVVLLVIQLRSWAWRLPAALLLILAYVLLYLPLQGAEDAWRRYGRSRRALR